MTIEPGSNSQKHAYLIMCHNNFKILQMLLSAIDDDRNDIYIYIYASINLFKAFAEYYSNYRYSRCRLGIPAH